MTSRSRRDVERRLDDLEEAESDGEEITIQEAMWEALVDYHTQ